MKQQRDINFEEDSEKKSNSQMGFEPTTLRELVGCSNHLSYWRLYGEQGPICDDDGQYFLYLSIKIKVFGSSRDGNKLFV